MAWHAFGIDVGGTAIKLGVFDKNGSSLYQTSLPTRTDNGGAQILDDIADAVNAVKKTDAAGIGIGLPGPVENAAVVNGCVNLGWQSRVDVAGILSGKTGLPVVCGNDANVAALGEMWLGGGKGHQNVMMVTLGTGVGGGLVLDGKIAPGAHGAAGEIGHIQVKADETTPCTCGNFGCLEQYASATGIVNETRRYLAAHPDEKTCLRDDASLDARQVFDAAKAGDPVGQIIAESTGAKLGRALATVACVTDPGIFVIGGGVAAAGDILLDPVKKAYRKTAFHACRDTAFSFAKLGNSAGMTGCVKLLLNHLADEEK